MKNAFIALLKRRKKTHSSASIATELGVTRQAVDFWLNGKREPSEPTQRLAVTLWRRK